MSDAETRDDELSTALVIAALIPASLLLSACLAPAVQVGLQFLGVSSPFARIFERLALLNFVISIIFLRRRVEVGLVRNAWAAESWRAAARSMSVGFVVASITAVASIPLVVASSRLDWAGRSGLDWTGVLIAAIPASIAVSLIEESLFRVLVFRGLARRIPVWSAALISSLLYGGAHFLRPETPVEVVGANPKGGLLHLLAALRRVVSPEIRPAAIGLTLIGILLCVTIHRTRSVAVCVGLHAGWFASVKVAIRATTLGPEALRLGSLPKRLLMTGNPWMWISALVAAAVTWFVFAKADWRVESRDVD